MIRVDIIGADETPCEGYLWRSDVILTNAQGVAQPLRVRLADGREFAVADLHEGPGYYAVTLPEGSCPVDGDSEVPWMVPGGGARKSASLSGESIEPDMVTAGSRSGWCRIFPRLSCC